MLNYILCSELMHHFGEIFDVTLGVPNATKESFFLAADGEIHVSCLAFSLPDNS